MSGIPTLMSGLSGNPTREPLKPHLGCGTLTQMVSAASWLEGKYVQSGRRNEHEWHPVHRVSQQSIALRLHFVEARTNLQNARLCCVHERFQLYRLTRRDDVCFHVFPLCVWPELPGMFGNATVGTWCSATASNS